MAVYSRGAEKVGDGNEKGLERSGYRRRRHRQLHERTPEPDGCRSETFERREGYDERTEEVIHGQTEGMQFHGRTFNR